MMFVRFFQGGSESSNKFINYNYSYSYLKSLPNFRNTCTYTQCKGLNIGERMFHHDTKLVLCNFTKCHDTLPTVPKKGEIFRALFECPKCTCWFCVMFQIFVGCTTRKKSYLNPQHHDWVHTVSTYHLDCMLLTSNHHYPWVSIESQVLVRAQSFFWYHPWCEVRCSKCLPVVFVELRLRLYRGCICCCRYCLFSVSRCFSR